MLFIDHILCQVLHELIFQAPLPLKVMLKQKTICWQMCKGSQDF